jgi:hypothetical protein
MYSAVSGRPLATKQLVQCATNADWKAKNSERLEKAFEALMSNHKWIEDPEVRGACFLFYFSI